MGSPTLGPRGQGGAGCGEEGVGAKGTLGGDAKIELDTEVLLKELTI